MKEHPILMSAPMVRAILDGRKTQTRRTVKPQPVGFVDDVPCSRIVRARSGYVEEHTAINRWSPLLALRSAALSVGKVLCPFGVVGDQLWVRETWAPFHVGQQHENANPVEDLDDADGARYFADGRVWTCTENGADRPADDGSWTYATHRWRPSIHMPRWASRLTLEVTEVRVQRLTDISGEDAVAEGFEHVAAFLAFFSPDVVAANPWMWAVSFKRQP